MFKYLNREKGQSTLEYAVLIVIIIAALLAMNQYIKRGLQGRLKSATDDVGDQFSPGNTNYHKRQYVNGSTFDKFGVDKVGFQNTTLRGNELTRTNENSAIMRTDQEYYGN